MGRGISPLQRDLLGLAYAVNVYTQAGRPAVKTGEPLDGYTCPTVDYQGPADLKSALGVYAVKRIAPSTSAQSGFFHGTAKTKSAKAAVSRAITRLMERGLLALQPKDGDLYRWGYVLTADGFPIAQDTNFQPPGMAEAVELFGIQAGAAYKAFSARYGGKYGIWCYENSWLADRRIQRDELIHRLQDALTVIEVPSWNRDNR